MFIGIYTSSESFALNLFVDYSPLTSPKSLPVLRLLGLVVPMPWPGSLTLPLSVSLDLRRGYVAMSR